MTPENTPVHAPGDRPAAAHDRRSVLRGAAVLGVLGAAGALSGCGGGSGTDDVSSGSSAGDAGAGAGAGTVLGPASEIPMNSGKIYKTAQVVVTQPSMGEYKAFSSICTHQSCPVADVTDTINCICHGSKYSISDGSVVHPPAPKPLPAKQITLTDGNIVLA